MDDRDLSPGEVASRLGVHVQTVLKLLRAGDLRGYKVGKVWRVEPAAIGVYKATSSTCQTVKRSSATGSH